MTNIISKRTIRALLEDFTWSWTFTKIENSFEDEGFSKQELPADYDESSVRRRTAQQYLTGIDLSDPEQVGRLVRVFEIAIAPGVEDDFGRPHPIIANICTQLERDGFKIENGVITLPDVYLLPSLTSNDAESTEVLTEHMTRLERSLRNDEIDPAAAIGTSKELVESACKLVLKRTGRYTPATEKLDFPALNKQALTALNLRPERLKESTEEYESVSKILGNLSSVAIGIAELRNKRGTGHGKATVSGGLGRRHAHLAAGASLTYTRFIIETLEDPQAPWHKHTSTIK